jgi:polyisoprenoid-binding protein YceI
MIKQLVLIATLVSSGAFAAEFSIDNTHTTVGFAVKHMMVSKVRGQFKEFEGKFSFDEKKPAATQAKFSIKTASIDTANEKRDDHLRNEDFFDAKKFPTITFESTKVKPAGKGKYKMEGMFSIHGVTKPITLDVAFNGMSKDPWGNTRAGFSITSKLNRKDYGLTWNKALETGGVAVGEDVELNIELEGVLETAKK